MAATDFRFLDTCQNKFDHCPIKICLNLIILFSPHLRPFRFEAVWLYHGNFNDFVESIWRGFGGSALDKTCALVEPLKMWTIQVFGHLKQKKNRFLAIIMEFRKLYVMAQMRFFRMWRRRWFLSIIKFYIKSLFLA